MITTRRKAFPATITGPRKWSPRPITSPPTAASRRRSPSGSPGGRSAVLKCASRWLALAALLASPAAAQDQSRHNRALAAGYKAAFLCSDIFNAGQTPEPIVKDDLKRARTELEPIFPELEANIDRQRRIVSVQFDDKLPPRVAAWRPLLGCAQLPIGASAEAAAQVPRLDLEAPNLD